MFSSQSIQSPDTLQADSKTLRIFLFGAPYVILPDGSSANFESDIALGLLAYLALAPDTSFRRARLALLLYPTQDDKQATQNFRQTLFRLRRAIQDNSMPQPYLRLEQDRVQFDATSACRLDVADFDAEIQFTQQHRHRAIDSCHLCINHLTRAVGYYQGELAAGFDQLEDFPFGDWLRAKRTLYRERVIQALHVLVHFYRLFQNPAKVEEYAERLEQIEPFDELGVRAMVELLAQRGERNRALRHYKTFKERLAHELDVLPELETQQLVARIKKNESPVTHLPLQRPNTLLTAQPRKLLTLPDTLVPFVNRQHELESLRYLLTSCDDRLITITGPSGSGKTRLAMRAASADTPAWRHGVWLALFGKETLPFSPLQVIANALGVPHPAREIKPEELYAYLRSREVLLLLDNVEHTQPDHSWLARLLNNAPHVTIIATALGPFGIPGESVLPIEGLSYPLAPVVIRGTLEAWCEEFPAVNLFLQHAQRVRPGFMLTYTNAAAIARICELVEGIPLAIEIAARWVDVLSTTEIVERMESGLSLPERPIPRLPTRHATFRNAFDYQFNFLTPEARQVLPSLARLDLPFTREFARQHAGVSMETFVELRKHSLLSPRGNGLFSLYAVHRAFLLDGAVEAK